ncbi:MAG: FKBP-type peptidyl-prolyl cis-trans isomerase [Proteobacteria bacterium]|nr:FKBP-type peptidyl-prolyl cis-trans isomerase [Pseudomonadota bacterium]
MTTDTPQDKPEDTPSSNPPKTTPETAPKTTQNNEKKSRLTWLILTAVVVVAAIVIYFSVFSSSPQNTVTDQQNQQKTQPQTSETQPTSNSSVTEYRSQSENTPSTSTLTKGSSVLKKEDKVVGSGTEVKEGMSVSVHYRGTFADGTEFDSSYKRNQPFSFVVGKGSVIQGWDQGLLGMKVGGERTLVIPPELAYGAGGIPGAIPANATLTFEIKLMDAQ